MKALHDLVLEAEIPEVTGAAARLYEQGENGWLPDAIADMVATLRRLTPHPAGEDYELHIERTAPMETHEEAYWDVWCSKENDAERYALDLSPWEEWLAVRVPQSLLDKLPMEEIVAHCVWEMTFYGFTQERIAEIRAELVRRVREVEEGKADLIPWEEVKDRLRAKFGGERACDAPSDQSGEG